MYDHDSGRRVVVMVAVGDAEGLTLRLAHERQQRLAHAHLARVERCGRTDDGLWWSVREGLEPPAPRAGALDAARLAAWLPGWLAGLGALHAAGLVHGALAPDSLGLDADGQPRLADLGRGWRIGQPADAGLPPAARPFAAPEVLAEGRVDARADLYALGALCYWWLTGEAPSADPDLRAEGLSTLPEPWGERIGRLLRPLAARRPASVNEVLEALPAVAPTPPRQVPPLIGRRAELERLLALADEVADVGAGRIVAVRGAAGSGKSRLMAELRHRVGARGWNALVARPEGRLADAPYGAWAGAITGLLGLVGPAAAAEALPALANVLPGICAASPAPSLEPRAEMLRLCRAIATLIEQAAEAAPLLICLEDWQAADAASRELLAYMARALPAVPYVVLTAVRAAADDDASAAPGDEVLPLGPLGGDDARTCWQASLLAEGGRDRRRDEWTPTFDDGEAPGLIAALVDARAAPELTRRGRGAGVSAELARQRTIPALWGLRLAAASPAARTIAAAAAIAGPRAGLALLGRIAELDDDDAPELLAGVRELIDMGGLVADGEALTLAAPVETALAVVAPAEARAMHGRALAYWRTAAQLGAEVAPALLARHALASEDQAAGLFYATAAARAALRIHALVEAESWLERAAALLGEVADAPAAWRLDLFEARGDLARFRARGAEAEAYYEEALALAELAEPARAAALRTSLGVALNLCARDDDAAPLFDAAAADMRAPEPARLRAVTAAARHALRHGRLDEAAARCRQVLEAPLAPERLRGEALGLLGLLHVTMPGQSIEAGLTFLEQARELARASGDRLAALNASMLAGNAQYALGRLRPARASFERHALLGQELGLPDEVTCATLNLAQVAYAQGRYQEAWDRARAGAQAAATAGNRVYEAFGQAYAGLAGCQLGQLGEAERALAQGEVLGQRLGGHARAQVEVARLEALIFLGRLGRAEELGLRLACTLEEGGAELRTAHALLMGQLYELAGELPNAVEYLRAAVRGAEAGGSAVQLAAAHLGFAQTALRAGQLVVAEARGADALALAEAADARPTALRAHLLLARVRWALGRPTEAGEHLEASGALARDLGSPHWQALTWQTLAAFSEDGAALRHKAAAYFQFYMNQLAPLARQEFLQWPERRDALSGRGTGALTALVPRAEAPRTEGVREARP